jgi:hypothetical protein
VANKKLQLELDDSPGNWPDLIIDLRYCFDVGDFCPLTIAVCIHYPYELY